MIKYMSGATRRLGTDVVADVLKAAIAFGWEPAELTAMTQPGPSICTAGNVTSVDLGDESQRGADLVSALERVMAAVSVHPSEREECMAAGIATPCEACRDRLLQIRREAIDRFDNDEGGQLFEDVLNTLVHGEAPIFR